MKKPSDKGTPINAKRYRKWTDRFGTYRSGVTQPILEDWLGQFKDGDKDLAARILDSILFFDQSQIAKNFRSALRSLPEWDSSKSKRTGRWFFVAMSGSAGESGDGMIYQFRVANKLDGRKYKELFIYRSDLVTQKLNSEDTVVLIDDFSGTGKQVCDAWNDSFRELVAGAGRIYLILIAATQTAQTQIGNSTDISLASTHILVERDNMFSNQCSYFSNKEKDQVFEYNKIADSKIPKGFGDCGLLVVFSHRCPNNSIPILHADHRKWTGLFPRHESTPE